MEYHAYWSYILPQYLRLNLRNPPSSESLRSNIKSLYYGKIARYRKHAKRV